MALEARTGTSREYADQEARNFAAYEQLKEEIPRRYPGQYVAIAQGRLVTASPDFDTAWNAVSHNRHFLVFPAEKAPRRTRVYIYNREAGDR
jgi:hypothetical protein